MSVCRCRPGMNEVCNICQDVTGKVLTDKEPPVRRTALVTLVFEVDSAEQLYQHLDDRGFAYYEMEDYFKVEGFTTLAEVEAWLEDK